MKFGIFFSTSLNNLVVFIGLSLIIYYYQIMTAYNTSKAFIPGCLFSFPGNLRIDFLIPGNGNS